MEKKKKKDKDLGIQEIYVQIPSLLQMWAMYLGGCMLSFQVFSWIGGHRGKKDGVLCWLELWSATTSLKPGVQTKASNCPMGVLYLNMSFLDSCIRGSYGPCHRQVLIPHLALCLALLSREPLVGTANTPLFIASGWRWSRNQVEFARLLFYFTFTDSSLLNFYETEP